MLSIISGLGLGPWSIVGLGLLLVSRSLPPFVHPESNMTQPAIYYACILAYNIALHPLRKYPGPRIKAAIPWWRAISYLEGTTPEDLLELHNRYGPVVRTAPNELSYINPTAFKEIYRHTQRGEQEFSKDERYHSGLNGEPVIINADRHYHSKIRKLLAHGFSERSLRAQETVLQEYLGVLFQKLQENSQDGAAPIDILKWYNVRPPRVPVLETIPFC